jgi:hypothetical protein
MSEKKPKITCAYCGRKFERSKLTRDHVVPSCLFEPLKPTKPITVLACGVCNNNEKSRDDAFLRDMVAADPVVAAEPDIDHLWNAFRRSAQKGHSEFYKMMVKGDPRAASLLLPHLLPNSIKLRSRKVLKGIARGLYYHEHKDVLPDKYRYGFRRVSEAEAKKKAEFIAGLGIKPSWSVGDRDEFQYVHLWYEDRHTTFWQMVVRKKIFYEVSSVPDNSPRLA